MNSNLFLPKKIKVGFQKRSDTYTKKLAYIIYYDNANELRKESSWENWRDKNIKPKDIDNVPTSGFVLNKNVGGRKSGWDYRQSYIRIYDPRGFEFEITISNLLFILEYNSCIKGKGLEGEYVYTWNGTELFLMPINSDVYEKIIEYNKKLESPLELKANDLQPGYTYLDKKNQKYVYLERHERYDYDNQNEGKYYWFAHLYDNYVYIESFKNIKNKFIEVVSTDIPDDYDKMKKKLKNEEAYKGRKVDFEYVKINQPLNGIEERLKHPYHL